MAMFFAMPGNEPLTNDLARITLGEIGAFELRQFPDGETYVRIISDVTEKDVFIVCTLARPDRQFIPLTFTAAAIAGLGARSVQLIAPYLAYMRQDRIFQRGEALTSRLFAQQLQRHFDGLITVDPHLHRHASIDEVYDIPVRIVHAAPLFSRWITANVPDPIIVGPDAESAKWVENVAGAAAAPWTVLEKHRRGDRRVAIAASKVSGFAGRTPVVVDDIVSSGATMKCTISILSGLGFAAPYCLAIHALCSRRTAIALGDRSAGFLTSNTVPNESGALNIAPLIAAELINSAGGAEPLTSSTQVPLPERRPIAANPA